MSGAGAAPYATSLAAAAATVAQNGSAATVTAIPSVTATIQSSRSWRGNPYVLPVGGGGGGGAGAGASGGGSGGTGGLSSYSSSQSPQSQPSPQHRAP